MSNDLSKLKALKEIALPQAPARVQSIAEDMLGNQARLVSMLNSLKAPLKWGDVELSMERTVDQSWQDRLRAIRDMAESIDPDNWPSLTAGLLEHDGWVLLSDRLMPPLWLDLDGTRGELLFAQYDGEFEWVQSLFGLEKRR